MASGGKKFFKPKKFKLMNFDDDGKVTIKHAPVSNVQCRRTNSKLLQETPTTTRNEINDLPLEEPEIHLEKPQGSQTQKRIEGWKNLREPTLKGNLNA